MPPQNREQRRAAANGISAPANSDPSVVAAADGTEGDPQEPAYVTKADFDSALSKIASDIKAELGRLRKATPDPKPAPAATDEGEPTDPNQDGNGKGQGWHKMVSGKLKELEEERALVRNGARRGLIRDALINHGADPELARAMVPAILEQEGENFKTEVDKQTGEHRISYQDGSLTDWAKAFIQTELGKKIVPAMSVPSLGGVPGQGRNGMPMRRSVPASQASGLTDDELRSGSIEIVPG